MSDKNHIAEYCQKNNIAYSGGVTVYNDMGDCMKDPEGITMLILSNDEHAAERDIITDVERNAPPGTLQAYYKHRGELQQAQKFDEIPDYATYLNNQDFSS